MTIDVDKCCQGYFDCLCFEAGTLGEENCPHCCLCLESTCCNMLAVNASRLYAMDHFGLQEKESDARLIQCNNCLQLCACAASVVACVTDSEECDDAASCLRCVANVVYWLLSGCITAQVHHEYGVRKHNRNVEGIQGEHAAIEMGKKKPSNKRNAL